MIYKLHTSFLWPQKFQAKIHLLSYPTFLKQTPLILALVPQGEK